MPVRFPSLPLRSLRVLALATACAILPAAPALAHPGHSHDAPAIPPWQDASPWPDRIIATMEADPTTSFAVTWRTDASVPATIAQIVRAGPRGDFSTAASSRPADTEPLDLQTVRRAGEELAMPWNAGLEPVHYHSVRFDGLEPDTLYAYRVRGGNERWSEWFHIRTAPRAGQPFRFVYMGDAQNGILSHWSRTVRASFQAAPDARFILHAGDLVNRGSRDIEWAEWFKAVGFIHGMIPAIPVPGNHEYDSFGTGPTARRLISAMWRPQFRLPVEAGLPETLREAAYKIAYNADLEVYVLDTQSGDLAAQAAWLDRELAASTARWRIVSMHHPIFSSGEGRDSPQRRALLMPVFERHQVDLVLQGHDHTYARGTVPAGDAGAAAPATPAAPAAPQRPERTASTTGEAVRTMYVNSVSGPKQYEFKPTRWDEYAPSGVRLDRFGEGAQFFQVIAIDGGRLDYRAFATTGELYDSFVLTKDADGTKRVTAGPAATLEQQIFTPQRPHFDFRERN